MSPLLQIVREYVPDAAAELAQRIEDDIIRPLEAANTGLRERNEELKQELAVVTSAVMKR
jgi:hypothetical protein